MRGCAAPITSFVQQHTEKTTAMMVHMISRILGLWATSPLRDFLGTACLNFYVISSR